MTHPLVHPLALPCGTTLWNRLCKASISEDMADLNNNCLYAFFTRPRVNTSRFFMRNSITTGDEPLNAAPARWFVSSMVT